MPLIATDTAARVAFYATSGVFVLLEQLTRVRSVLNRSGSRSDHGSLLAVVAAVALGVAAAFIVAGEVPSATIGPWRWDAFAAGLALMWAGIAVRQWAIILLGRFFTVDVRIQSGQTVIDRGPYRWVRHPSYSALIITLVGMGLALGNWLSLLILIVVPTVGLLVRIRVEERALFEALGEPYRRFAADRRRLFPGVW